MLSMRKRMTAIIAAVFFSAYAVPTLALPAGLNYPNGKAEPNVIPFPDSQLLTAEAKLWTVVTKDTTVLEGPAFDKSGNLFLTDTMHGKVIRIDANKNISNVLTSKEFAPCAVAVDKDGRLFVAVVYFDGKKGKIFSIDADGKNIRTVVDADQGFLPNDMVFDQNGGLYFTDARGDSGNPAGGVYYVSPDHKNITPVIRHLSGGNGIALSPDGKMLWVVEFSAGVLHRLVLKDATTVAPFGETVAYRFNSPAPDSMKADADGNLYIALHGQGRVIVLNRNATAIGQIIIPGRDEGKYLRTANMAIRPGTREIYILSSNDPELKTGGAIFKSQGFSQAEKMRSDE